MYEQLLGHFPSHFVIDLENPTFWSVRQGKGGGSQLPIARLSEEHNPFIAWEDSLTNRIAQHDGATPPWVEVQMELEAAVNAFRETLRTSWTRRAFRTPSISEPASFLSTFTSSTVRSLRDREWEERERSYYDTAIANLNSLVPKYKAMAPSVDHTMRGMSSWKGRITTVGRRFSVGLKKEAVLPYVSRPP